MAFLTEIVHRGCLGFAKNDHEKGSYYLYCLRKPSGEMFYVGKGSGGRINQHFCPSSLSRSDSPIKNNIINKYGVDNIYREILCYFDDESEAYEMESLVIEELGIMLDNSGSLSNISRETGSTTSGKSVKYSDDFMFEVFSMYYEDCLSYTDVRDASGIGDSYLYSVLTGKKRPDLYRKFIKEGLIHNRRDGNVKGKRIRNGKCTVEELIYYYDKLCTRQMTFDEISDQLGIKVSSLREIYSGKRRSYLGFDYISVIGDSRGGRRRKGVNRCLTNL